MICFGDTLTARWRIPSARGTAATGVSENRSQHASTGGHIK